MINLKTNYANMELRNPIIIASSGLTSNVEKIKEFDKAGAGAIVLKSLFEEQIEMQANEMLADSSYPEATDYIFEYVKANHLNKYLELIRDCKKSCSIPIIASINCYKSDVWADFAKQIAEAGADALELNVFYLETEVVPDYEATRNLYINLVRRVKEVVSIPVIIKIGKNSSNIPALVHTLEANGADGVVIFNRFYQPDIDIEKLEIVSGNVFSSHAELSDTLRWTAIISSKVPEISISSSNGIHDWQDVIKCILSGADAVQMCTSVYTNGAKIISQALQSIEAWMQKKQYQSLDQFRGKLDYLNIPDPTLYERVQFMKYYSNRK